MTRCETELIGNVDDTTDAPNVILTFPTNKGFDCFADGDVVQYNGDIVATTDYGFFFDDPDVKNFSGGSTAGILLPVQ